MNCTTVAELIASLSDLPQDLPIILSSDEEGNSYRFLEYVGISGYDNNGEIEVGILELTSDLEDRGFTEEDVKSNKCVVIS